MPSEDGSAAWSGHRLHPASILFGLGQAAKGLLLPGIVVLWAARGSSNYEVWLMILFIPAAIAALVKYWTYRYRFETDEMVIREGVLTRNERHIPYVRVQNIDLVQNPVHRLLRVAQVSVETASGGKPEAVIRVLGLPAVEEMRARVFGGRDATVADTGSVEAAPGEPQGEPARSLHRLTLKDLVVYGVVSNRGMAVVAAALGILWQLDRLDWNDWVGWLRDRGFVVPKNFSLDPIATGFVALLVLLLALVALRVLSVIWVVLKFHGFHLQRRGDDMRTNYGLLTRVSATIPRHRIQLLTTRQGLLQRWFGRTSIRVETAGGGPDHEEGSAGREKLWLAPLIRTEDSAALVREVLPEIDLDGLDWRPLAPRARVRVFRESLIVAILVSAGALFLLREWSPVIILPAIVLAFVHSRLYVKHTAYSLTQSAIAFRSGWWLRRTSVVRFNKIQVLQLGRSPFDRRHGMSSVRVDTAGASGHGHSIEVPYLERETAQGILGRLYDEASRTAYRW